MPFFEGLSNQYYTIKLSNAPSTDVIVSITADDPSVLAPITTQLTFTNVDFATEKKVLVSVPSSYAVASYDGKLNHAVTSADARYGGGVGFTGCDVTSGGQVKTNIIASSDSTIMLQSHVLLNKTSNGSYQVTMNQVPASDVKIKVSSISNSVLTVDPQEITFTSADWTPKTFNVQVNKAPQAQPLKSR